MTILAAKRVCTVKLIYNNWERNVEEQTNANETGKGVEQAINRCHPSPKSNL